MNRPQALQFLRAPVLLVILLSALLLLPRHAHAQTQRKQILYINAYHPGYKFSDDIERALNERFAELGNIDLRVEYLDAKRIASPEYFDEVARLYQTKYANATPDLIISSDDAALNFLFNYGDTLFPQVPVVFVGANYFDETRLQGFERFTGISLPYK